MWRERKKPTKPSECMNGQGCKPSTPRPTPEKLFERSYIIRRPRVAQVESKGQPPKAKSLPESLKEKLGELLEYFEDEAIKAATNNRPDREAALRMGLQALLMVRGKVESLEK